MHVVLRRAIRVDLPPERALHLFTPVGERLWVDEWAPTFPAGEQGDGAVRTPTAPRAPRSSTS